MTKHRAPLTIDAALARIAGQLPAGWPDMAAFLGRKQSLVRAWGDPERREKIPMADAVQLDVAYRAAGGDGAPLYETYGWQLEEAGMFRFADEIALGRLTATAIREGGEAHAALVLASQPGCDPSHHRQTMRELDEAIASLQSARLHVAARAGLSSGPP
jgi:hypothetical protein